MATVTMKLDLRIDQAIKDRLAEINNPTTMLQIYNNLAKRCDPYVPFLNGPLSQTAQISSDGVRYIQPYARYQYYGDGFNHTKDYHPLASARWNEAMMRDHGEEFIQETQEIIEWRIRKARAGK